MSTNPEPSTIFWNRLLAAVDIIDQQAVPTDEAVACLLALEEGFSECFDPADNYPEYVAVMLCRAARHRIELTRSDVLQTPLADDLRGQA